MTVRAARLGFAAALTCILLSVAAFAPRSVGAVGCVVSVTNDDSPAPAGSLREKVNDASCDSITFTVAAGSTITLTEGQLVIDRTLTITGPGAANLTISGNNAGRVFVITNGTVAISGLTVANGNGVGTVGTVPNGGGIAVLFNGNLSLDQMIIRNNTSVNGGGGVISENRALTVTNSVVRDNKVTGLHGGGIAVVGEAGSLIMSGTTVSGNQAAQGGGGIESEGGADATITNSTIAGNSAGNTGGGLVAFGGPSVVSLTHVTVSGNTGGGSAIGTQSGGSFTIKASIIANSIRNCGGTIVNDGYNVDSGTTCGFGTTNGSVSSTNPLLAALGDYGGSTPTIALLPGSPAINRVPNEQCIAVSTDQRMIARPRPANGACDSGAFESRGFSLSRVVGDSQSAVINTAFGSPLVVGVSSAFGEPVAGGVVTYTGPDSGAGIQGSPRTATIGANGQASITPTANGTVGGPYIVSATANGATTGGGGGPATYQLTISTASTQGGSGTVSPGTGSHAAGSTVTLTAFPGANSLLVGWTLDENFVGFANPLDIAMNADHTVVATFAGQPVFNGLRAAPESGVYSTAASDVVGGAGNFIVAATSVDFSLTNLPSPTGLVAADASGTYSGTTTLSATLTSPSGGAGIENKAIVFTLNGTQVCNNAAGGYPAACPSTNSSGVATLGNVSLAGINAGSYPTGVGASFAGDATTVASSDTAALTVAKAATALTQVSGSATYGDATGSLTATLRRTNTTAGRWSGRRSNSRSTARRSAAWAACPPARRPTRRAWPC